jgi:prepilin-type N-terminal cleavage/methylation domain-containing protein
MTTPRGFTLVELLLAMVLALLVGGVVHRLLLHGQRLARAQSERMALQENVRAAALVLSRELGAIGFDEVTPEASAALGYPAGVRSDLLALAPGSATYLAERGGGRVCGVAPGASEVVIARSSWESPRAPRVTDSLLVFAESDPATSADDGWIHFGIASNVPAGCPDGQAGIAVRLGVPAPLDAAVLGRVTPGAPVRLAEVMEVRHYESGGKWWFGMRSVSTGETITPVAGPLADSSSATRGLTLVARDAAGLPAADLAAARAVEISLLGITDEPVHGRDLRRPTIDSFALTTRVALRNALRP